MCARAISKISELRKIRNVRNALRGLQSGGTALNVRVEKLGSRSRVLSALSVHTGLFHLPVANVSNAHLAESPTLKADIVRAAPLVRFRSWRGVRNVLSVHRISLLQWRTLALNANQDLAFGTSNVLNVWRTM